MTFRFLVFSLFLLSQAAFSQIGPGGVGNASSNVLWLSADYRVYNNAGTVLASSSDNVMQWDDRSGNSRNALQSVVTSRPNYFVNVVNGLPVVRFSAGDDHIISTGINASNVSSVWAVAAFASLPSPNPGIVIGSSAGTGSNVAPANKNIGMWVSSGGINQIWGRGIQSNGTVRDISQGGSLNSGTFYMVNNMYRISSSINQFLNGGAVGSNLSHNGTLSPWTDITVGRQGNESWNGDIAEVIFYNIEVNDAQQIIINNYLSAKYGLSLATNDLYDKDNPGNGNFDFEVAGIGRINPSNAHSSAQGSGIVRILNPNDLGNNEFLFWGHNNGSIQASNLTDVPVGVQARMARVWRVSEVNSSGTAVDVGSIDIQFDLATLGPVTSSDLRLLVDTDNDGVFTDETPVSGASLVSGTVYQFTGVSAITNNVRFSLGTINKTQTPLPVELLFIKTRLLESDQVEIMWSTATEKNNERFEVQRSIDGVNWEVLGEVSGAINSVLKQNYSFIDKYPYPEVTYYRIKQFDLDGEYSFSPVEIIDLESKINNTLVVYPNPSSGEIIVQGDASEMQSIEIFDRYGRAMDAVSNRTYIHTRKIVLNISTWLPGVYYLKTSRQYLKIVRL